MTSADFLPAAVLKRKAVVYVRQSTQAQVQTNLESQRRQYDLVEVARRRGFRDVEVIDDDLGRSASGMEARPGFDKLVAWLCAGEVGAVLCFDASRLARNGRDWHHLLELCGLVQARVIDLDGIYNPCRPNDRLLLGMKGSISEFETGIIRARMYDAARAKARRGELRISVPIGYVWHREIGVGFDPDLRIQDAIRLIFSRFRELGSARQVLLSMTVDQVHFPRPSDSKKLTTFEWTLIRYRNVISVLKNPFYAGAYVYGKSEKRTEIVDGRARKSYGHGKPFAEWEVLLRDHHEGYIDWAEFERNQKQLAVNAYGKAGGAKSIRGGRALLAGLLSCGRCGRRLKVAYTGRSAKHIVYRCELPYLMMGLPRCQTFGGARVDPAIARELLRAVEPMAIEAALEAERRHMESRGEQQRMAEGAREGGAEVDIRRVPETAPPEVVKAAGFKADTAHPVIESVNALADYDAIIIGAPTRFGRMPSQMAAFLDTAGGLCASGKLNGKVGGAFTSTATQHGGQEATLFSIINNLLHFGLTVVGLDYGYTGPMGVKEVHGSAPYGATTIADGDGSRQPSEIDLGGARYQGKRIAETAAKLAG